MRRLIPLASALTVGCTLLTPPPHKSIDVGGMSRTIQPGDDFFGYANGQWMTVTPIPPDKSSYGNWDIVIDITRMQVQNLIQDLAKSGGGDADARKAGDYYAAYLDEAGIEARGLKPLTPLLDDVARIADKRALARAIGASLRADVDPLNATSFETDHLFGVWISQGLDDPSQYVPYLLQGGLGMPDRDYYVSTSPKMAELRTAYEHHVASILTLAGQRDAATRAARILALETKMARAHATRLESQDVHAPQRWSRADLAAKATGLDWDVVLDAAGLAKSPSFIVWHPNAVKGLAALVASEPLDAWKDWLTFHIVSESSGVLPKSFGDETFAFYGHTLNGTPKLRARWERGIDSTNVALGDAVGRAYVARHFPPETKAKVEAMVGDLRRAFAARIDALTWMSDATKAKAKAKLNTLRVGVGYPDTWRNYGSLEVKRDDAFGNARRASLFEYQHQLAKLGQPVDRNEWWMNPQTVNALNLPLQNALNFPAAILQAPFFDAGANAACNYGSIGAIIGHEISHSFDDQGSQFDAEGRLADWWTKADFDHFKAAGDALAALFSAYKPFPDLAVNGRQTLSENIADVAGLSAAWDAYHSLSRSQPIPIWHGFTADQQFFISFGQSWRTKTRAEALRQQIATDGHAPDEYRADTVRNLDAWYDAFAIKSDQRLFLAPDKRVHVW